MIVAIIIIGVFILLLYNRYEPSIYINNTISDITIYLWYTKHVSDVFTNEVRYIRKNKILFTYSKD
jgi:hypothetical protein